MSIEYGPPRSSDAFAGLNFAVLDQPNSTLGRLYGGNPEARVKSEYNITAPVTTANEPWAVQVDENLARTIASDRFPLNAIQSMNREGFGTYPDVYGLRANGVEAAETNLRRDGTRASYMTLFLSMNPRTKGGFAVKVPGDPDVKRGEIQHAFMTQVCKKQGVPPLNRSLDRVATDSDRRLAFKEAWQKGELEDAEEALNVVNSLLQPILFNSMIRTNLIDNNLPQGFMGIKDVENHRLIIRSKTTPPGADLVIDLSVSGQGNLVPSARAIYMVSGGSRILLEPGNPDHFQFLIGMLRPRVETSRQEGQGRQSHSGGSGNPGGNDRSSSASTGGQSAGSSRSDGGGGNSGHSPSGGQAPNAGQSAGSGSSSTNRGNAQGSASTANSQRQSNSSGSSGGRSGDRPDSRSNAGTGDANHGADKTKEKETSKTDGRVYEHEHIPMAEALKKVDDIRAAGSVPYFILVEEMVKVRGPDGEVIDKKVLLPKIVGVSDVHLGTSGKVGHRAFLLRLIKEIGLNTPNSREARLKALRVALNPELAINTGEKHAKQVIAETLREEINRIKTELVTENLVPETREYRDAFEAKVNALF